MFEKPCKEDSINFFEKPCKEVCKEALNPCVSSTYKYMDPSLYKEVFKEVCKSLCRNDLHSLQNCLLKEKGFLQRSKTLSFNSFNHGEKPKIRYYRNRRGDDQLFRRRRRDGNMQGDKNMNRLLRFLYDTTYIYRLVWNALRRLTT